MLQRTQVFVDTSYLLASFYNSWQLGARSQLEIDLPEVVCLLNKMVEDQLHQPVHRQMWYDGIPDSGPHRYQRSLRTCNGVILRAGQLIEWGERHTQKAVDTRLVADMVLASVRGLCSDLVLVSGDADMIPGVQEASAAGVRVHLYGFGWDSMSSNLRHSCDSTTILDPREDFADCMQLNVLEGPLPPQTQQAPPPSKPVGEVEPIDEPVPYRVPLFSPDIADSDATSTTDDVESQSLAAAAQAVDAVAGNGAVVEADTTTSTATSSSTAANELPGRIVRPGEPVETEDDRPYSAYERPGKRPRNQDAVGVAASGSSAAGGASAKRCPILSEAQAAADNATRGARGISGSGANGVASGPGGDASYDTNAQTSDGAGQHSGAQDDEPKDCDEVLTPDREDIPGTTLPVGDQDSDQESAGVASPRSEKSVDGASSSAEASAKPAPKPSMMAPRRRLRSRYVPLPNEVWASAGFQSPFDVGQQYACWWYENAATAEDRDQAHLLSGGGLPPDIDRPLLQFACETLHEYTLTETQRVRLRDGFHSGIRTVLINLSKRD